jgi:hypothetical protein
MIVLPPFGLREYRGRSPSTDLYVLNPLRRLQQDGTRLPALAQLAPNVYMAGRTGVIVRYGGQADLDRLERAGARRIVYVADDDFEAGAADPRLPDGYRAKLAAFASGAWPAIRAAADIVIVPGAVLAAIYGEKAWVLAPAWHRPPARVLRRAPQRFKIAHLGTASHRADMAPIRPLHADIVARHRNVRVTLFSSDSVAEETGGSPQVRHLGPMAWWRYKLALRLMRYDLALYPLADAPFNRARSANKLYEHALVGAASLMSPIPALREAAGAGLADIFVEGDEKAWRARIESDIADPVALRRRAEATRAHILASDPLGRAARAWREILAEDL